MVYAAIKEVLGDIHLLTKILLLVPAKPLIAFKTVSRSWSSIISDGEFQNTHTDHHPLSLLSGFYYQSYYWSNYITRISFLGSRSSIPMIISLENPRQYAPTKSTEVKILDSCNGLILCHNLKKMTYSVLNPTTGKYRLLSEPLSLGNGDYKPLCFLAFDPTISRHYKVVQLKRIGYSDVTISIFSSENKSCKELSFVVPRDWIFHHTKGVFWNGAINWISEENRHIRFIVEEESFTSVIIRAEGRVGYFGECGHSLHLVKFHVTDAWRFQVFEINKETNFWFRNLCVDLGPLWCTFAEMNPPSIEGMVTYSVLSVKRNKDNFCFVSGIPDKIISYWINMDSYLTMTKILGEFEDYTSLQSYLDFYPFVQCLAPV